MKRDFTLERTYPHPPERVWRALTDRRALSTWLMETDFEPVLGKQFTFRDKPRPGWDGITHGEVIELEPPRRLAYTWRGRPGPDKPFTIDTVVRWTLEPAGTGTRVVIEHTGFAGFRGVLVSFILSTGWKKLLRTKLADAIAAS
jgi:uncharacterized protein YndB with AHSA1/START domain